MIVKKPDGRSLIPYDTEIALRICEEIAAGTTVVALEKMDGFPKKSTIYRWLAQYPKFYDAYERARELSAQSFEDEALERARDLVGPNDFTAVKVRAYAVAMEQLRWSASRRDKARYGQQVVGNITIPIQINTNLGLQPGDTAPSDTAQSVYHVEATVIVPTFEEAAQEERLDGDGAVLDLSPNGDENTGWMTRAGVEEQPTEKAPEGPKPRKPRLPKRHKTAAQTAKTAARYAATIKNKEEPTND